MSLQTDAKSLANAAKRRFGHSGKERFHRAGKKFLKSVLAELGCDGDIRSNKGGPAVIGEVVLHTDGVYVQLCVTPTNEFMYRTCKGRKDYCGGDNRWFSYDSLALDPMVFVDVLKEWARIERAVKEWQTKETA